MGFGCGPCALPRWWGRAVPFLHRPALQTPAGIPLSGWPVLCQDGPGMVPDLPLNQQPRVAESWDPHCWGAQCNPGLPLGSPVPAST